MFIAQLDRFGYVLTAIGSSEKEAKQTIIKEYKTAYKQINGSSPAKDMYGEGRSYLELAKEEIDITEINSGEVAWL